MAEYIVSLVRGCASVTVTADSPEKAKEMARLMLQASTGYGWVATGATTVTR